MLYNNAIVDTEAPISSADLTDVEQRFGFSFPESVKMHGSQLIVGTQTRFNMSYFCASIKSG